LAGMAAMQFEQQFDELLIYEALLADHGGAFFFFESAAALVNLFNVLNCFLVMGSRVLRLAVFPENLSQPSLASPGGLK